MVTALGRQLGEVVELGPVSPRIVVIGKILHGMCRLFGRRYDYRHSAVLSRSYARAFRRALTRRPVDLIFAPAAATEIAWLDTKIPIVYASDATFALLADHYPSFTNLLEISRREADRIERRAVHSAALVTYPSEWAARSAIEDYGVDPAKVVVAAYGPNLDVIPERKAVLARRPPTRTDCRLLLLGVSWTRKGGHVALEALEALELLGVTAELVVCGCVPPSGVSHPRLRVIPSLDKDDPAQRAQLYSLLQSSHILLLPTQAETYGIVFCEASAFGMPVVATATGGVSAAVRQGVNGFLLPPKATGAEYAGVIADLVADPERYKRLAQSARDEYETRLNWDAWGRAVAQACQPLVDGTAN
jgi:glycosyltransferase involved in cell wall biosynthesis